MEVPVPSAEAVGYFFLGVLVGLPAPYWYAAERVQGFSRAALNNIPYSPPPGVDEEEAMERAVDTGDYEDDR